jgi:hypothetical protein
VHCLLLAVPWLALAIKSLPVPITPFALEDYAAMECAPFDPRTHLSSHHEAAGILLLRLRIKHLALAGELIGLFNQRV